MFFLWFGGGKCSKMVICALFWSKKNEKMADFCGFAGVCAPDGAVFRGFFVVGRVIFVTTVDFVMPLG